MSDSFTWYEWLAFLIAAVGSILMLTFTIIFCWVGRCLTFPEEMSDEESDEEPEEKQKRGDKLNRMSNVT